ncbi:MAG: hypothetical protein IT436_11105 [Phycisphaerales bacterium]|nr:hypothetical protein [Phycisphaerales bacterium]
MDLINRPVLVAGLWMAAVGVLASQASAQHAGDILLEQSGGRITTGLFDADTGLVEPGVRVFGAEFIESFANEPGFDSFEGAFPAGSQIGFDLTAAMRLWDAGTPGFDTIPDERVQVRLGPLGPVLTPLTDEVTPGFAVAVGADGRWHHHLGYTLLGPADPGIYLLEMRMWSTAPGAGRSEPFWIVFNQGMSEAEHDAAIAWLKSQVGPACRPDLNGDGVVDFADYLEFLNRYDALDASVDFTGDGVIDFGDYLEFLNLYEAGCH